MDLSERPASSDFRRHPWEVARARFFRRVLAAAPARPRRVLDVGAGDGWFARELLAELPPDATATCWDSGYAPATLAALAAEAPPAVRFVAERPRERFDALVMLDVIEHVEDDLGFLAEIVRDNLAPGGVAVLSAPAWPGLYTAHDRALRHFRRYVPAEAFALLARAGLRVGPRGGLFPSLLLPRALAKARETLAPPATAAAAPASLEWTGGPWLTRAVDLALRLDAEVSFRAARVTAALPGLSWWALCTRP